jgi:hypothetical protein
MRKSLIVLLVSAVALLAEAIDWHQTTRLPRASWRHACTSAGSRIYFLGGGEGPESSCDHAVVNPDGTLGAWVSTTPMPVNVGWFSADATAGHIYVCGGWNLGGLTSSVWYAAFDSAGGINTWLRGTSLPAALYTQGAVLVDSNLYVVGGATGVGSPTVANVRYARVQPDGSLGPWTETSTLPEPLRIMGVAAKDSWLYSVGGRNQDGNAVSSACFARRAADGSLGPWTATTSLPQASDGLTCAVVGERIYAVGGWGAGPLSSVYSAQVNPDGTLGNWSTETPLPVQCWAADGLAVNSRIYVPGGYVSSPQVDVYYSSTLTGLTDLPATTPAFAIAVTPNPIQGGLTTLHLGPALPCRARSSSDPIAVTVYDAAGSRVWQSSFATGRPAVRLDLASLRAGAYLLRVSSAGQTITQRIVLLH